MIKSMTTLPIEQIKPYENNPRLNDDAVEAVRKSMEQCGYIAPIVVDEDCVVLAGHTRLKALKEMGASECEVLVVGGLDDEQKRKYRLLDNKTNELALWDFDKLADELEWLDFDDLELDWMEPLDDWFNREVREENERQEGNDEYNEFLEKFEVKKTTDDCYTPDNIYDAVADWVSEQYGISRDKFCRPFYPGGDYQRYNYAGKVVVDNPPFSIITEIMRFYIEHEIKFFLFAPSLTLFSPVDGVTFLVSAVNIQYENKAKVETSFVTNMEDEYIIRTVPDLHDAIKVEDDKNRAEATAKIGVYKYPSNVISGALLGTLPKNGIAFNVKSNEAFFIRYLDAQNESGKSIYGGGFLISDERAKQAEEARKQAEEARKQVWELSDREKEIIRNLG